MLYFGTYLYLIRAYLCFDNFIYDFNCVVIFLILIRFFTVEKN